MFYRGITTKQADGKGSGEFTGIAVQIEGKHIQTRRVNSKDEIFLNFALYLKILHIS